MNVRKFIGDRDFYSRLYRVLIPVLIQNVITNFVSLLDNIMVGQVGTEPMSGVAIVNQILFVYNLCIFGGLAGAGIFTAQFYGKGDHKGVRDTFRAKLYTVIIILAVFMTVFAVGGDMLIMQFLHEGGEALDLNAAFNYGRDYLHIMLIQLVPFALMQVYGSTLRETGETLVPMRAGVAAVLVNLFFNWVLIFGKLGAPAMGVVGAAIATVISRFVEFGIIVIYTHTHKEKNRFIVGAYSSPKLPLPLAKKILIKGAPLLINELLWASGMTTMNQCYSMRGLDVVSAVNISSTVSNLFFCSFLATGTAISIIVGQLLGAGELDKAVDENRKLIAFSVAICVVVGAVMALLAPFIPRIYNTSDNVKAIASQLLTVSAVMMPFSSFCNACYFTLRSGGKTGITFIFDSAFMWVLCVPLAFFISRYTKLPILPMFIIIQATDFIKCAIGYVMVKNKKWVNNLTNT